MHSFLIASMNKYHKLLKNSGMFLIANFGSKILTFLLVGFYTSVLNTAEYGIADLLISSAGFIVPVITLSISEAMLRFSIDDVDHRANVFSAGLFTIIVGNVVFLFLLPLVSRIQWFSNYYFLLYLLVLSSSILPAGVHFCRGIGKTKLFAISGVFQTLIHISLNLFFLLVLKIGLVGYLLASILCNIATFLLTFFVGKLYQYISFPLDLSIYKEMLQYSIPLIPNSVFWWLMQSADRYVTTGVLGSSANGIYSVANKIPTIIASLSSIFMQAWQLSSVEESKSDNKNTFYSTVFNSLATVLILGSSFLMVVIRPFYSVWVDISFFSGWQCTPFLLMAMVFSCFSSFLGTNYIAMKRTKGVLLTTGLGAIVNMILNIILTPVCGIIGTGFATMASFAITWLIRMYGTREFVKIKYQWLTFILPMLLLLVQSILPSIGINTYIVQSSIFLIIILLTKHQISSILHIVLRKPRNN